MSVKKCYNEKGDAIHYARNRLTAIVKYERVYGTLAVMTFCEMTADKYRERIGRKEGEAIAQEALKISWYENAAEFYYKKIGTVDEIIVDNTKKYELPWKKS